MKTLIIDNYDSFTYNLYQLVADISGVCPLVIRNDELSFAEIQRLPIDNIIISPGPGNPEKTEDFGVCQQVLRETNLPVLGVCLGHQGLCSTFGGKVGRAPMPVHGQLSEIKHWHDPLFADIPQTFMAVRYHSLIVEAPLPDCLKIIAETQDGLIMGVRHLVRPLFGIQYHPESICSEYGRQLLVNFLNMSGSKSTLSTQKQAELPFSMTAQNAVFDEPVNPPKECNQADRSALFLNLQSKESNRPKSDILNDQEDIAESYLLTVKSHAFFLKPESVFQALFAQKDCAVWLDSSLVTPGLSRFSIMGCLDGPLSYALKYDVSTTTITRTHQNQITTFSMPIFDYLQQELQRYVIPAHPYPFDFSCGFIGYLGYELFQETLPLKSRYRSPYFDAQFLFLDRALVFDHQTKEIYLLALHDRQGCSSADIWFQTMEDTLNQLRLTDFVDKPIHIANQIDSGAFNQSEALYHANIQSCIKYIQSGDSYEICLTNQFKTVKHLDPIAYYMRLRQLTPAPYAALLRFGGLSVASASVERFLNINAQGEVETKPIKGTLPRGATPDLDEQLKITLANDVKYRAENLMIVDLLRNDLGRVCEVGSVVVTKLMQVESYKMVHQLVSTIRGQLKADLTSIDCIRALFPAGSMTGAPKIRTVDIIQQLETEARGIYSGSIGYLSLNGTANLNVVIRTAVIDDEHISMGAGGAIIALSQPEAEYEEMCLKIRALRAALEATVLPS